MSLIVPSEFKKDINPMSGFIKYNSKFGNKNTKGLFLTPENAAYLSRELFQLITHEKFVQNTLQSIKQPTTLRDLHKKFATERSTLNSVVPEFIRSWQLPYREDSAIKNPIQELHNINQEFLITTARNIITSPDILLHNVYDYNEHGALDTPEWEYGAASYADGTWHPEHLFTQSARNRANPYWVPVNITFDTNPAPPDYSYGAFHPREKHYSQMRENMQNLDWSFDSEQIDIPSETSFLNEGLPRNTRGPGPGNRYKYDFYGDYTNPDRSKRGFSRGGTFPRWQYSVNHRQYERDISEGLSEGGHSDRRTQRPSGYDMSTLLTKSSY